MNLNSNTDIIKEVSCEQSEAITEDEGVHDGTARKKKRYFI